MEILPGSNEDELYATHAKIERAIGALSDAKAALDDSGHFDTVLTTLRRALETFDLQIDAMEWAKSAALKRSFTEV